MVVTYNTCPELTGIHNCAFNVDLTRMIVCNAKGRVQICDRTDQQQQLWQATIDLPVKTKPAVTQVPGHAALDMLRQAWEAELGPF